MLWYLLYPIRGTTDPPRLPADHPIRRAFYRHGTITTRHWLISMLVSVAIGVIFVYPVVFLSDFPSGGISGLPHQVWNGSSSFESQHDKQPDVEIRQLWIHGSYMKALDKSTLQEALILQSAVLGDATNTSDDLSSRLKGSSWGYHSPLRYWDNSLSLLNSDDDVVRTINEKVEDTSLLDFTLRPLSGFAAKSYRNGRLASADALVITLINRYNEPRGDRWQNNIVQLAGKHSGTWNPRPSRTHSTQTDDKHGVELEVDQSKIYEYRSQPLSSRQNSALALAYGFILLYVVASLRRLKAFRSRFGLVVTAVTQMTTSILSSFTICGLLRINLAQIPPEAYPLVVLTIGLENIFRLINAVVAYPPEMLTTQRIANGLGDVGHSSLASAAQTLLILWLLSMVVSPGVSAFCAFAAVALLFDYFFLITFFVAVLNVDMKRLELQDSIVRSISNQPASGNKKTVPFGPPSWIEAIIHGRVPFSTRIAGSAVTVSFVLALNWHFSDHSIAELRSRSWHILTSSGGLPTTDYSRIPPPSINQTEHPSPWLRMQNSDNAVHFMNIIKSGASSFTARIFDPVVIVLAGADRTGVPLEQDTWLSALRNLAIHNFYPFALAVVFVVAFVTVLMNFLLWDSRAEKEELELASIENNIITSTRVATSHRLDIIKIAGGDTGNILSVGLDRTLSIAKLDPALSKYQHSHIDTKAKPNELIRWPVNECYISSSHMAILCGDGQLLSAGTESGLFTPCYKHLRLDPASPPLLVEQITSESTTDSLETGTIIVLSEGTLMEIMPGSDSVTEVELAVADDELVKVCMMRSQMAKPDIIGLTSSGLLVRSHWDELSKSWQIFSRRDEDVISRVVGKQTIDAALCPLPHLELAILCTRDGLTLIDSNSLSVRKRIGIANIKTSSLRVLHSEPVKCEVCSATAVHSISFAYTDAESGNCVLTTFLATTDSEKDGVGSICLSPRNTGCMDLETSMRTDRDMGSLGIWEATMVQAIAGVRRRPTPDTFVQSSSPSSQSPSSVRKRKSFRMRDDTDHIADAWEAWAFTIDGELHTSPLDMSSDNDEQLYVVEPGPICLAGPASVAVAIGNTLHIIQLCREPASKSGASQLKRSKSITLQSRKKNASRKSL